MFLIDSDEPSWQKSSQLKVEPSRICEKIERLEPQRAKERIENEEPKSELSHTLKRLNWIPL